MRSVIALLFLVLLQGCDEDVAMVSHACNLPCYTGPEGTAGQGICQAGVTVCDENNVVVQCDGQITPEPEMCDLIDNDCDGITDNNVAERWANRPCGIDVGACSAGKEVCHEGQKVCSGREDPTPERCNGVDDDCDGLVDNIDGLELCYSADSSTLAYGECRAGVLECVDAQMVCMREKVPTTEVCNGLDDDCDGLIDEDLSTSFDLFFVLDASGSMGSLVNECVSAAHRIAEAFVDTDTLMGASRVPGGINPDTQLYEDISYLTDLVDPVSFQGVVLNVSRIGGGSEPTVDAVYDACAGAQVSWRQDSTKAIIVFSDEPPQSQHGNTVQDAVAACISADVIVYAVTTANNLVPYQDLTQPTGGETMILAPAIWMTEAIMSLFAADCY